MKNTKEARISARKIYIPAGAIETNYPEIKTVVYTYTDGKNRPCAIAFVGTASKPAFNYYYVSQERRETSLNTFISDRKKSVEYREEQKAKNKNTLSPAALTAKCIKERLSKEFPGVKFSVKSDYFSGGNSVNIIDGPITKFVEEITDQYQYGRFDGMQDLSYNVDIERESLGCSGAKYVSCSRSTSDEHKESIKQKCIEIYGYIPDEYMNYGTFNSHFFENRHHYINAFCKIADPVETVQDGLSDDSEVLEESIISEIETFESSKIILFSDILKSRNQKELVF